MTHVERSRVYPKELQLVCEMVKSWAADKRTKPHPEGNPSCVDVSCMLLGTTGGEVSVSIFFASSSRFHPEGERLLAAAMRPWAGWHTYVLLLVKYNATEEKNTHL